MHTSKTVRARRRITAATVAVVASAGGIAMGAGSSLAAASPPTGPSRNLADYVVFARESLSLKGEARAEIRGGNVGVNADDPRHGDQNVLLNLCNGGGGRSIVMDKDSQVVADSVSMNPACDIGYLFTNEDRSARPASFVPLPPGPDVDAAGRGRFVAPIIADDLLPPMPDLTDPAHQCDENSKVTVKKKTAPPTMAPGRYGDGAIDGTLTLGAGTYVFCNLTVNQGGKVVVDNPAPDSTPTIVEVVGVFSINGGTFGSEAQCSAQIVVSGAGTKSSAITLGRNSDVFGQLYARDGRIQLGHATDVWGRIWGNRMVSDAGLVAHLCGTPPGGGTPTTTIPTTSTTLGDS